MSNLEVHFKSGSPEHTTPRWLYDVLNAEFGFQLDPAATAENALCGRYYTKEVDGLSQPWAPYRVFCNPPYGKELPKWVAKAHSESQLGALVVMLIPARPDTTYWHHYIFDGVARWAWRTRPGVQVRWISGRLKFGGMENSAPFPSAVIVFSAQNRSGNES